MGRLNYINVRKQRGFATGLLLTLLDVAEDRGFEAWDCDIERPGIALRTLRLRNCAAEPTQANAY